jgi:hypothetical protein
MSPLEIHPERCTYRDFLFLHPNFTVLSHFNKKCLPIYMDNNKSGIKK